VNAYTTSNCLDAENNYYDFLGCAYITVPPAVWMQTLKPNKGTLKLSFTATLEDCGSPVGIPHILQGTEVQVNLDLVCKPRTTKCSNTFNGTPGCPACKSERCTGALHAIQIIVAAVLLQPLCNGSAHAQCSFTSTCAGCQTCACTLYLHLHMHTMLRCVHVLAADIGIKTKYVEFISGCEFGGVAGLKVDGVAEQFEYVCVGTLKYIDTFLSFKLKMTA
jgi:hypothetical protein